MKLSDLVQSARKAGFSDTEISDGMQEVYQRGQDAGLAKSEIDAFFGVKDFDPSKAREYFKNAMLAAQSENGDRPLTLSEAIDAGLQSTVGGLAARGKAPSLRPTGKESWYATTGYLAAQQAGDLPLSIAGMYLGSRGGIVGAMGGAAALPTAFRSLLMDYYANGTVKSFDDFMERASGVLGETAKSFVTGAAMGKAGALVSTALSPLQRPIATFAAKTLAEVTAGTAVSSALEQQIPDADSIIASTVLAFGLGASSYGYAKMRDVFALTGTDPQVTAESSKVRADIAQDLASGKVVPDDYLHLVSSDPQSVQLLKKMIAEIVDKSFVTKGSKDIVSKANDNGSVTSNDNIGASGNVKTKPFSGGGSPESTANDNASAIANDNGGSTVNSTKMLFVRSLTDAYQNKYNIPDISEGKTTDGPSVDVKAALENNSYLGTFLEAMRGIGKKGPPELPPDAPSGYSGVLSKISFDRQVQSGTYSIDKLLTHWSDDLTPIKRSAEKSSPPIDADPYIAYRLLNGISGKVHHWLNFATFGKDLENTGPSLKAILEPIGDTRHEFTAYITAKRDLYLRSSKEGFKSPFEESDVRSVVADGDRRFGATAKQLREYQRSLVNYAKDNQLISEASANILNKEENVYVPWYRVLDDTESGPHVGKGRGSVTSPVKSMKGVSDRDIVDPLESIVKNTFTFLTLADRNNALLKVVELEGSPLKRMKAEVTPISDEQIQKYVKQYGLDLTDEDIKPIYTLSTQRILPANQIAVFVNGKRQIYEGSEDVLAALKGYDSRSSNILTKIANSVTSIHRAGITLAPEFAAKNMIRDQLSAFLYTKNQYLPFSTMFRGLFSVIGKDKDYQLWLKSGGASATFVGMDRHYINQELLSLINNKDIPAFQKTWNVVKSVPEYLRLFSELMENATRVGEFKSSLDRLRSTNSDLSSMALRVLYQAAMESREITLDFSKGGSVGKSINKVSAFFNAQVQGTVRLIDAVRTDPTGVLSKAALTISVPSLLLWMANHKDERWKELKSWERDLFWIVMTKDHVYRIPKPDIPGIVFGSMLERTLDAVAGGLDQKDVEAFVSSVFGSLTPNVIPDVVKPPLEQLTNYSFFSGHALVPDSLMKMVPEYQYTPYTTELTRTLGKIVGFVPYVGGTSLASPVVIDNYIRGWGGTIGVYTNQLLDVALRNAGVINPNIAPRCDLASFPIIKAFMLRYPSANAESILRFMDDYADVERRAATIKALSVTNRADQEERFINDNQWALFKLTGLRRALGQQNAFIQKLMYDPDIPEAEKCQIAESTYRQMIQMANGGNQIISDMKKDARTRK